MDAKELKLYRNFRHRIIDRGQVRLQQTDAYKNANIRFQTFLSEIKNPVAQDVVRYYYADVRSIVWIAQKLNYSESQIKRIKKKVISVYTDDLDHDDDE
jgi:DNA-directed RNA polymerase specialized sigma subunit